MMIEYFNYFFINIVYDKLFIIFFFIHIIYHSYLFYSDLSSLIIILMLFMCYNKYIMIPMFIYFNCFLSYDYHEYFIYSF